MKFLHWKNAHLAMITVAIGVVVAAVCDIANLNVLALIALVTFVYSFILLDRSTALSDILVSFFAYVFNLFILLFVVLGLLERW